MQRLKAEVCCMPVDFIYFAEFCLALPPAHPSALTFKSPGKDLSEATVNLFYLRYI